MNKKGLKTNRYIFCCEEEQTYNLCVRHVDSHVSPPHDDLQIWPPHDDLQVWPPHDVPVSPPHDDLQVWPPHGGLRVSPPPDQGQVCWPHFDEPHDDLRLCTRCDDLHVWRRPDDLCVCWSRHLDELFREEFPSSHCPPHGVGGVLGLKKISKISP